MKHNEPKLDKKASVQKDATGTIDLLYNLQPLPLVDENNRILGQIIFRNTNYETQKFNAYILEGIEKKERISKDEEYLVFRCAVTRTEITGMIIKSKDYRIEIVYTETSKPVVTEHEIKFPIMEMV
jgi:hypothetical protein